jgi:hypothetical protein
MKAALVDSCRQTDTKTAGSHQCHGSDDTPRGVANEGGDGNRYLRLIDSIHFFWPNQVRKAGFL